MSKTLATTWDGKPISPNPPYGACIIVYRHQENECEFLVLHRAHHDAEEHGDDWAWTPPSGARYPGEMIDDCAVRELREETGLELDVRRRTPHVREDWRIYTAEASAESAVRLDAEHDCYEWLPLNEAIARCLPPVIGDNLRLVGRDLGLLANK